jgi:uncharacterized membrane protein YgdD (TMEM256/DUF423 family)
MVWTWLLPLLLVPPSAGLLSGWLSGISMSPVVGVVIPILVGLLGAFGLPQALRSFRSSTLVDGVLSMQEIKKLDATSLTAVKLEANRLVEQPTWLPTVAGLGVLLFFGAFYLGVSVGIRDRIPQYPAISEVVTGVTLQHEERLAILKLSWGLKQVGLPTAEYVKTINDALVPVLSDKTLSPQARAQKIQTAVLYLLGESSTNNQKPDSATGTLASVYLKSSLLSKLGAIDNKLRQGFITPKQAYEELSQHVREAK